MAVVANDGPSQAAKRLRQERQTARDRQDRRQRQSRALHEDGTQPSPRADSHRSRRQSGRARHSSWLDSRRASSVRRCAGAHSATAGAPRHAPITIMSVE